ncbi:MAG: hypothetical protein IPL89_03425 [Acidobacteria bacterium]|nr:hypothetical protein [Acidobacteriota bacterium]
MNDLAPQVPRGAATAALVAASLLSLVGGALVAVPLHGVLRFAVGMGGFAGYVGLFARALKGLGRPG